MVTLRCAFTIAQGKVTILTHLEAYCAVCHGKSTRQSMFLEHTNLVSLRLYC